MSIEKIVADLDVGRISNAEAIHRLNELARPSDQRLLVATMLLQGILARTVKATPLAALQWADELIRLEKESRP